MKDLSFRICALLLTVLFVAGCGGSGKTETLYKASGKLTAGGKPLKNVRVTFNPADGDGVSSSGVTNDQGEFVLVSQRGKDGAVAGKHKVVLTVELDEEAYGGGGGDPSKAKSPFPSEYGSVDTTPKEVEVTPDGDNSFTIEL